MQQLSLFNAPVQQLSLFDLPATPAPEIPAPIEFEKGDQVVGTCYKTGQTISGSVEQIGNKYLVLDGNRPAILKTAERSLTS